MTLARLRTSEHRPGSSILGLGTYRGSRKVDSGEMARMIDVPEKWIVSRSGIRTRRWATEAETVTVMGVAAGREALAQAGVDPGEVDCVIVATISHLLQTPSAAVAMAADLGAVNAAAFDISAACAGFCYALAVAGDMVRAGGCRHVLVIGSERVSDMIDIDGSPSTSMLFADGAGAVLVGPSADEGIGPVAWGADGSRRDVIRQAESWAALREDRDGPWPGRLEMSGREVFRWARRDLIPVAHRALELGGVGLDDLAAFIPHQANGRIVTAFATGLGLPEHVRVAFDVAEQGNTSSASVPLAMSRLLADREVQPGGLALLIGFGAGLVHAAQVVRLPGGQPR